MNEEKNFKIVVECPLCDNKELNVVGGDKNLMQCIGCGYSSSDDYIGSMEDNKFFKSLDDNMKRWAMESNGQIWVPSILNLSIGIYYPIDEEDKMKWAFAPIKKIPENERNKYVREDGKFYEQKYDTDNQIIFDDFGRGLVEINLILELKKNGKKSVEKEN